MNFCKWADKMNNKFIRALIAFSVTTFLMVGGTALVSNPNAQAASEVKIGVPPPPAFLRQDMPVSVDSEVAHRSDAVIVPADAVRDATGAQPWVLALNGHHAVRRPVKLGLRGDSRIEILSGVAPGDMLIPSTNALIKPGQRVRAAS